MRRLAATLAFLLGAATVAGLAPPAAALVCSGAECPPTAPFQPLACVSPNPIPPSVWWTVYPPSEPYPADLCFILAPCQGQDEVCPTVNGILFFALATNGACVGTAFCGAGNTLCATTVATPHACV